LVAVALCWARDWSPSRLLSIDGSEPDSAGGDKYVHRRLDVTASDDIRAGKPYVFEIMFLSYLEVQMQT